jgi:hypothetical protein
MNARALADQILMHDSKYVAGIRGADQTYNARRARFMNSQKGSYKKKKE